MKSDDSFDYFDDNARVGCTEVITCNYISQFCEIFADFQDTVSRDG
jgi:hypothetical protein